jgi:hypothetical protein
MRRPAEIVRNDSLSIPAVGHRGRRILLLNPPVYDAQYWARWSQPAGLLRISTLLKQKGYQVNLIDCMETDEKGLVRKTRRKREDGTPDFVQRDDVTKPIYHFGLPWAEVETHMRALPEPPDEIWIGSIMTYWWQSTRDAVSLARHVFSSAHILVGGIYPTLAPEHAAERLGADLVMVGEISEASNQWTDFDLYDRKPTQQSPVFG